MLVCSIRAGVFNVNPQSGIEFPNGSLLIVQLKSRAIKGHMGPVSAQKKKKKKQLEYIYRGIFCLELSDRTYIYMCNVTN